MIIECPACHSKYRYDEERFGGKAARKIRCARCREVFEIHNPSIPVLVPLNELAPDLPPPDAAASPAAHKEPPNLDLPLEMPSGVRLSLAVLEGPDAGGVYRIDKPRVTIGRSGADLELNDGDVSRLHAAVEVRGTAYSLSDLGSTNGTVADGEAIAAPVELTDKSEFRVGSTTLMLIVTDEQ